jgi:hypothetical protein
MATSKLSRDAFLYLDPHGDKDYFAQCSTCQDWVRGDNLCVIHSPHVNVPGTASCGFYVHGDPQPPGTPVEFVVTPEESGLVDREVRCENCKWGGPTSYNCELYDLLNTYMSDIFLLDTQINPKGCCNAQQPREA